MALTKDGELWAWGRNGYGETGIGRTSPSELPHQVGTERDWKIITAGDFTDYAMKTNGTIWAWGLNFTSSGSILNPQQVSPETNWVTISAGSYHLAGLKSDGSVWIIGPNTSSVTGESTRGTNWVQIGKEKDWAEIRSGDNSLLARKTNRTWYYIEQGRKFDWGELSSDGMRIKLPLTVEPLAMRSERRTMLIMMPDGRLWSLGRRINGAAKYSLVERISHLRLYAQNIFGANQTIPAPRPLEDSSPVLIWEAGRQ